MSKYNSIIILGPTGTGKTELSIDIAKQIAGEIISADSMQIYKYFDIGTAKATKKEQSQVKHHMIDIVEPEQQFTVADYKKNATLIIEKLLQSNIIPIIVGGTGLYIDSLIKNYSFASSAKNIKVRQKYELILENKGKDYLYNLLQKTDEKAATKLHPNDTRRVIRALEIYETTKLSKSENITKDMEKLKKSNSILKPLIIGLNMDRAELYEKINQRVDKMIDFGLMKETQLLYSKYNHKKLQPMIGIGYKELFDYYNGTATKYDAIDKIKQNSRKYAKRQLTWFNKNKDIIWFNKSITPYDEILSTVIELYNK